MSRKEYSEEIRRKYVFICDNERIRDNLEDLGYSVMKSTVEEEFEEKLTEYLYENGDECIFVAATATKKINDAIVSICNAASWSCINGWKLFTKKDYLGRPDKKEDLADIMYNYLYNLEGPEDGNDFSKFMKFNEKGFPTGKLKDQVVVDYLIETIPLFVIKGTLYYYKNGVFIEDYKGLYIKQMVKELVLREYITTKMLDGVYKLLLEQLELQKNIDEVNDCPRHYINFQNCIYDPIKDCVVEHDPRYLMINQIPHEYHPEAVYEGPAMDKYMNLSIPDPIEQTTVWEYLGYCMTFDTELQRYLMLTGDGGTGKSVLIDIALNLVGKQNYSSVTLQNLNERFCGSRLQGKLLNACGDLPTSPLKKIDVFKRATGEDAITHEKKFADSYDFFSYAKLLFSANEIPANLDEKTNAYYRRMLVIDMNVVISEKDKDYQLKLKLKKEINYIVNKSMQALKHLYETRTFTESEHSKEKIVELRRIADTVQCFIEDEIVQEEGSKIIRSEMHAKYLNYCKEEGRSPLGKEKFFSTVRGKGYIEGKSNGIYVFKDIEFRENKWKKYAMGVVPFPESYNTFSNYKQIDINDM